MEINLLPQKPSLFQPAWILWGTTCVIFVFTITSIPMRYHNLKVQETLLQQQQASLTSQQNSLLGQRNKANPRSEQLLQYKAKLNLLEQKRVNWQTRLNTLSSQLPPTGVIVNFSYQGNKISMKGKFDSVKTVVQYVELLKKVTWIRSVALTSVTNSETTNTANVSSGGGAGVSNASSELGEGYNFNITIQTTDQPSEQNSGGSKQ